MPLNPLDFSRFLYQPKPSGIGEIFENYYKGYEQAQTPAKLARERIKEELMNSIYGTQAKYAEPLAQQGLQKAQLENQYYGRSKEADIAESIARAQHYRDQASGRTFAPSALGKLIQERNDLEAREPDSPLLAEYDRVIKAQGASKQYAPSSLGKLANELQQVEEGFLPGSNGSIALSPEQQDELRNNYALQMQKAASDQTTRTTVLRGQNLLQSINASNIDDLTRYSGLKGSAKLKLEQAKDLNGKPSEEYLKYLEATQAAQLEAKELRQFFGDSITPEVQDAIYKMVNATSLTKSPEAAKRMIQKSRDTIKKQIKTFTSALESPEAYKFEQNIQQISSDMYNGMQNQQDMITIRNPKTGQTKQISRAEYEAGRKKK
jgi:hypothetical protein